MCSGLTAFLQVQTDKAALEAQLAGATSELASAQAEAKAAREEAIGLASQLETADKAKVGLQSCIVFTHLLIEPHCVSLCRRKVAQQRALPCCFNTM